ncbi:uncharacterized protein LOC110019581 [Phalaenopsis equestris]|uniref:uncharacterized protein LOC110019581 n=1 Tax=Phalaenopsis equestris TaxID=78828 RepID=UPI0009E4EBA1|nr:uncharacterized protein LOC110019581 [Phalaenopsis equestris]
MPAIRSLDEDGKNLGFVVNGSEGGGRRGGGMEKKELAEEKACFGRDDEIDPDALSYIDEKIQNVLGHFQKEFEGGVYGESLGAKFGGYGSFLPVYSRSPSISLQPKSLQPKSPVKTPNHNVSRSPNNLQSQDGHQNPSILGTTSITKVSIGSDGQLTEKPGIKKASISVLRSERILQSLSKPVNLSDNKMQEVRMMVGNEDAFPRKKPDIYSDLGLDVSPSPSPSPSLDDFPNRNEECSSESADAFLDSPTTILQIMTCFSVPGGYILSPLPDSLQNSNGKEDIFLTNFKTGVLRKGQTETCAASSDTSLNLEFVNGSPCKSVKSGDTSQMLRETDRLICEGDVMPYLKKETGIETIVAQNIICSAPDISQSSRASCGDAREERLINGSSATEICHTAGNLKDSDKLSLKERIPVSHVSTDSHAEFMENMRNNFAGNSVMESIHSNGEVNSKSGLTTKSYGERIGNNQDTSCQPTETESRALKNFNTTKVDSKRYDTGWKNHAIEHKGPANQNQNPAKKDASCEKGRIDQPLDGDIIPIVSPTNDLPCIKPSKENLGTSSSVELKRKNGFSYESKLEENKSHKKKKKGKAVESHNGFGESTHIQKVDENKHTFGSSRFIEKSKLELGLDTVDNHQIANLATDEPGIASLACNAPTSDVDSTIISSVIKENWVICDLCQTWRLLPYGTNPDKLPKEWQCSMQVWL